MFVSQRGVESGGCLGGCLYSWVWFYCVDGSKDSWSFFYSYRKHVILDSVFSTVIWVLCTDWNTAFSSSQVLWSIAFFYNFIAYSFNWFVVKNAKAGKNWNMLIQSNFVLICTLVLASIYLASFGLQYIGAIPKINHT